MMITVIDSSRPQAGEVPPVLTDDAGDFVLSGVALGAVTLFAQSALAGKGQLQLAVPEGVWTASLLNSPRR